MKKLDLTAYPIEIEMLIRAVANHHVGKFTPEQAAREITMANNSLMMKMLAEYTRKGERQDFSEFPILVREYMEAVEVCIDGSDDQTLAVAEMYRCAGSIIYKLFSDKSMWEDVAETLNPGMYRINTDAVRKGFQ